MRFTCSPIVTGMQSSAVVFIERGCHVFFLSRALAFQHTVLVYSFWGSYYYCQSLSVFCVSEMKWASLFLALSFVNFQACRLTAVTPHVWLRVLPSERFQLMQYAFLSPTSNILLQACTFLKFCVVCQWFSALVTSWSARYRWAHGVLGTFRGYLLELLVSKLMMSKESFQVQAVFSQWCKVLWLLKVQTCDRHWKYSLLKTVP